MGTIYVITNNINDKEYVGQTWYDINYRFKRHTKQKKCIKLARAMDKELVTAGISQQMVGDMTTVRELIRSI